MSKKAFVFPGQSSQQVGMGEDLYNNSDTAKDLYDLAEEKFEEFSLKEVSFKGPKDKLTETKVTQPAMFVNSVALYKEVTKVTTDPDAVAGHSLGEFSALVAAGALSFEECLNLVKIRSQAMQEATKERNGTMAAIIGLEFDEVKEVLKENSSYGVAKIANYNSEKQIVISGETNAIQKVMVDLKDKGAKRAIELSVSGAFHSPLMESAKDELKNALEELDFQKPDIPIYSNVTGTPTNEPDKLKERLGKQLTSSVLWVDTIKNMINNEIDSYLEIGAGRVLQGLIRRISRDVDINGVSKYKDLENI